jgi:hypothetical protein
MRNNNAEQMSFGAEKHDKYDKTVDKRKKK